MRQTFTPRAAWPKGLWLGVLGLALTGTQLARAQAPAWQQALAPTNGPGSTAASAVRTTAADADGNVYVAGTFSSSVSFGGTQLTSAGGQDVFVAKWSPAAGAWAWAVRAGGTGTDDVGGLAVSGAGVYVAGTFASGTSAGFAGVTLAGRGGPDAYLAKFVDGGSNVANGWAVSGGGTGADAGTDVAVSGSSVYLAGSFTSAASATVAGVSLAGAGGTDAFLARYTDNTSSAASNWAVSGGGTGADAAQGVAVSGTSVYLTGSYASGTSARFGASTLTGRGDLDLFLAKYVDNTSAAGNGWVVSGGGTSTDAGNRVAASGGSVYVAGSFTSASSALFGTSGAGGAGSTDGLLVKYTDNGTSAAYGWLATGGGSGADAFSGVAVSGASLYVGGSYTGTATAAGTALTSQGLTDALLAKYLDNGTSAANGWATSGGGTGADAGYSPAVSGAAVWLGGGAVPPATFGSQSVGAAGGTALGYLARLTDNAPTLSAVAPASAAQGNALTLNGTNLTGTTTITFAGTSNNTVTTGFTVNAAGTQLTGVVVPTGAATGQLTVTTANGVSNALTFTLTPLQLLSASPVRNTIAAGAGTNIGLTFNGVLSAAQAQALAVFSPQLGGRKATANSGVGTSSLTLDPAVNFRPGEVVSVSVPAVSQVVQFGVATASSAGRFGSPTLYGDGSGTMSDVAVGDVTGDGLPDVVVADRSGPLYVWPGQGNGQLGTRVRYSAGSSPGTVVLGDLNRDGRLDVVANNFVTAGGYTVLMSTAGGGFAAPVTYSTSQPSQCSALGDLNGDGWLDVVDTETGFTDAPGYNLAIRYNQGDGTLGSPTSYSVGSLPGVVVCGDLNNDGKLDIVATASKGQLIAVLTNTGSGSFTSVTYPGSTSPLGVSLGDLNEDGRLDVITSDNDNFYYYKTSVYLNTPTGLAARTEYTSGVSQDVDFVDVNGDGHLDAVTALYGRFEVRLGDGTGALGAATTYSTNGVASTAATGLADLNGDGRLDIVTANDYKGTISVLLNMANTVLTSVSPGSGVVGTTLTLTGSNLAGTTVITFVGVDGTRTTVTSGFTVNAAGTQITGVVVPAGAATGQITATTPTDTSTGIPFVVEGLAVLSLTPAANSPTAPRPGAVQATFNQPLTAASAAALNVYAAQRGGRRTRGAGTATLSGSQLTYTPTVPFLPGEAVTATVSKAAVGADGSVLARPRTAQFKAATGGTGRGTFSNGSTFSFPESYFVGLVSGDLDGDGDLDLASASNGTVYVHLNNGLNTGVFTTSTVYSYSGASFSNMQLGDVEGDGDLDIFLNNNGTFFLRNGDATGGTPGTFTYGGGGGGGSYPSGFTLADLDADGDLDVINLNYGSSGYLGVNLNGGDASGSNTGTFYTSTLIVKSDYSFAYPQAADMDNDGDLDLVAVNQSGTDNKITVFYNTLSDVGSSGLSFVEGPSLPLNNVYSDGQYPARGLELGDIDGDGDVDLLYSYTTGQIRILTNNGTGTFTARQTVTPGNNLSRPQLTDLDADGDLDLLLINSATSTSGTIVVYLNGGDASGSNTGQFTAGPAPTVNHYAGLVATGDFDGDGDVDMAIGGVSSSSSPQVSLHLNGPGVPTIVSFTPASGPVGTTVTLTGTNLSGATSVTFNGTAQTTISNNTGNSLTVSVPAGATTGLIRVLTPGGMAASATAFTVTVPQLAVTQGGTSYPSGGAAYSFGSQPTGSTSAAVTFRLGNAGTADLTLTGLSTTGNYALSGTLPTTVPAGGAATVGVTFTPTATGTRPGTLVVTSSLGTYTINLTGTGTVPAPVLAGLSPTSGPVGTAVTLTGSNLGGVTSVSFNGTIQTTITTNPDGSLTVSVPAGATSGPVTATTPGGPSNGLTFTVTVPATAAPVVTAPASNSYQNTATPTYAGTAPAGSTVTVYVDGSSIGTTTATAQGGFSLAQPAAAPLAAGSHTVRATAQASGATVSSDSNTNTFTVDLTAPTATLTTSTGSPTSSAPLAFAVSFSESVLGLTAAGLSVSNGTVTSGPTGSGPGPYTFQVTPLADGVVTVRVLAGAAQDAAGNGSVASNPVSVTYATQTVWNSPGSTDWFDAGNWTAGVPTTGINALIPGTAVAWPVLSGGTASVRTLTIGAGATLTQSGGSLDVRGNWLNNGTFTNGNNASGGTVLLGQAGAASIGGSSPTRFWNLTVQGSGAALGTTAETSVQRVLLLNASLATQGNPLVLVSDATGTALVVNNAAGALVNGAATYQRYLDPRLNAGRGYRHLSAPVAAATVASLGTAAAPAVANPAYNTSATPATVRPYPTVFGYDQARLATASNNLGVFDKGWVSPATTNEQLGVGLGYSVHVGAGQALGFTGQQNNAFAQPLTVNVSRSAPGALNATGAGWALVGNPFPAPLDYALVAPADRQGLDPAIYVFESNSLYGGSYRASLNGVGGNASSPNSVLALGQGFFVRVSDGQAGGTLNFRNSQRLTSYQNPSLLRTTEIRPLVELTLQGAPGTPPDAAYVYCETGATDSFEAAFDAVKLPNPTGLNLSASTAGRQLAISGLAPLGGTPRVVPLAVGVPAAGPYTLTAAQLLNLSGVPVYLRDLLTGAVVDLARQPSYPFTVADASALVQGRFELVFSPQALATAPAGLAAQVALYPNPTRGAFAVELPASLGRQAVAATLLDALGREVRRQVLPAQGATPHQLTLAGLPAGVYALRLTAGDVTLTRRVVLE